MFVSSSPSCSNSLSFRLVPPLTDLAGDLSLSEGTEAVGDILPFSVGVAVCARIGGGRIDGGRIEPFRAASDGRTGADMLASARQEFFASQCEYKKCVLAYVTVLIQSCNVYEPWR